MSDESETQTSPHGTDESGQSVETVTTTATRLPSWWKIGAVAVAIGALLYFGDDSEGESNDET
jgi:hypothetical protein